MEKSKNITLLDQDYLQWVKELSTRYRRSQIKAAVKVKGVSERNIYYCKKFYTLYSQYVTFAPQVEAEMKQTVLPQL